MLKIFLDQVREDKSTMHPKFDLTRVQTHDLQIMTVHFMSLFTEAPALTTCPSVTSTKYTVGNMIGLEYES